ncbi:MAG: ABC transporter permease [Proteobacteria bacterium]|nr:ABC transporter permease [Pseudomonadota bacterium]
MSRFLIGTWNFFKLLYFTIVSDIRQSDGNALRGLIKEVMRAMMMVAMFYVMITVLNMRGAVVRGNFVLFLMSGIFLFMTHNKAVAKISGSGGATNPMLKHAPVSTLLLILSSALSSLYIQILSMGIVLLIAHTLIEPIVFYNFKGFIFCFFIAWLSGVSIGLLFLALSPYAPSVIVLLSTFYRRANMIFSGKMLLASTLPGFILPMFTWNPLFHAIDQARGYTFINYNARVTDINYPIILSLVFLVLGIMLEHWARKYVSESWSKR